MSDSPFPIPTHSPEPAEVIRNAIEDVLKDTHCSNPAVVLSYNASTQLAQVQPLLMRTFVNDDGTIDVEAQPVINNVPVAWPAGGGFRMTFPLGAGDIVGLIFADQSLDIWKSQGGQVDPVDQRIHSINDCWAIPQVRGSKAWTAVSTSHVQLGQDGAAGDFVATAQRVQNLLSALKSAINGWTPVPNDGGAALKTALSTLFTSGWPSAPASSTVEILG